MILVIFITKVILFYFIVSSVQSILAHWHIQSLTPADRVRVDLTAYTDQW